MEFRKPLAELRNHAKPARRPQKTYGKRRGRETVENDIFAPTDENQMEQQFESLEIKDDVQQDVKSDRTVKPLSTSTIKPIKQSVVPETKQESISKSQICFHLHTQLPSDQAEKILPLLKAAGQEILVPFEDFGERFFKKFSCEKIGEGSYGDVYKFSSKDDDGKSVSHGEVFKIIPINPAAHTESDAASTISHVLREVKVLELLTELHGFVQYRGVTVVQGRFPEGMANAFKDYAASAGREDAQKTDPDVPSGIYAIIEMDDVGVPVGKLQRPSAFQVYDLFWQTAIYMSIAEEKLEFEHRDLHRDNICIRSWGGEEGDYDVKADYVANMTDSPATKFNLSGIRATLIDYGRARARTGPNPNDVIYSEVGIWNSDQKFKGDILVQHRTYQKQVQLIREAAYEEYDEDLPSDSTALFVPETNAYWLFYLVSVLLLKVPSSSRAKTLAGSSMQAKLLQMELWTIMGQVKDSLEAREVKSAKSLLEMAVERDWLSEEDQKEFRRRLDGEA